MAALDTNVLVRVFVDDPTAPAQCALARNTVQEHKRLFISQAVQLESVWVLQRAYQFQKNDIIGFLQALLDYPQFVPENPKILQHALALYADTTIDFGDALIYSASQTKAPLLTFDKALGKLAGVTHLVAADA